MATKKTKAVVDKKVLEESWPKVTVGSHLTVYTYQDGTTRLEWDDQALEQEVRDAIATVENTVTETKTTKRKKKA